MICEARNSSVFPRARRLGARAALAALLAMALPGCMAKRWDYRPEGGAASRSRDLHIAVVCPFQEGRPPAAQESVSVWWLVPLVPFSSAISYYPETRGGAGTRADYRVPDPSEEEITLNASLGRVQESEQRAKIQTRLSQLQAARAAAAEIRKSGDLKALVPAALADEIASTGLAKEVFLAPAVGEGPWADLYITGKLELIEQKRTTFSYGLTIAGPVLWLFLPATATGLRAAYTLEVRDHEGRLLMTHTYRTAMQPSTRWIYSKAWGAHYTRYAPRLLRTLNARAASDLEAFFDTFPKEHWDALARVRRSAATR